MNFAVSLINLTIGSLTASNLFASPFLAKRGCISASRIRMDKSFGTAIFNFDKLFLKHSHFSKFLATVIVKESGDIFTPVSIKNGVKNERGVGHRVMNIEPYGGGVYTLQKEETCPGLELIQCTFQTCCSTTPQGGGVIYANMNTGSKCSLKAVSAYRCTGCVGAFAVVKQAGSNGRFDARSCRLIECSPSVRQAHNSSLHLEVDIVEINVFNVTKSYVLNQGAGISVIGGTSVNIQDFAALENTGNSMIHLRCPSANTVLNNIYIRYSNAKSSGLFSIYGSYEIDRGCFYNNTGKLVHSDAGKIRFVECWFTDKFSDSVYAIFDKCALADYFRHFTIHFAQTEYYSFTWGFYENKDVFPDQEEIIPPEMTSAPEKTKGFVLNTTGTFAVVSACLIIPVIFSTVLFISFLQRYRQGIVHKLHIHCANECLANNPIQSDALPLDIFDDDDEHQVIDYNVIGVGNAWDTDDEGVIQADETPLINIYREERNRDEELSDNHENEVQYLQTEENKKHRNKSRRNKHHKHGSKHQKQSSKK